MPWPAPGANFPDLAPNSGYFITNGGLSGSEHGPFTHTPPASTVDITCNDFYGTPETEWVAQTYSGHIDFDMATAVANIAVGNNPSLPDPDSNDWRYVVEIRVASDVGITDGGAVACANPTSPFGPRFVYEDGRSEIALDPGMSLRATLDGSIAPTTSASGSRSGSGVGAAYLVNPDSTWPVPDIFNNDIGEVLWTHQELTEMPPRGFDWEVHWTGHAGSYGIEWRVSIVGYLLGRLPQHGSWICVL